MNISEMTIQQLKEGVQRCRCRLELANYGLMLTKESVLAAKRQYKEELEKRGIKQLDF